MIFHNDDLMNDILRSSGSAASKMQPRKVSIDQMNDSVCYCIANLLHPFSRDHAAQRLSTPLLKAQQRDVRFLSSSRIQRDVSNEKFKHSKAEQKHTSSEVTSTNAKIKGTKIESRKIAQDAGKSRKKVLNSDSVTSNRSNSDSVISKTKLKGNHTRKPASNKSMREMPTKDAFSIREDDTDLFSYFDECSIEDTTSNYTEDWNEILRYLIPDKNLKFISSYQKRSRAITSDYKKILMSLLRDVPKTDLSGRKYKNTAAVLVARVECFKSFEYERNQVLQMMKEKLGFVDQQRADLWTSKYEK